MRKDKINAGHKLCGEKRKFISSHVDEWRMWRMLNLNLSTTTRIGDPSGNDNERPADGRTYQRKILNHVALVWGFETRGNDAFVSVLQLRKTDT